MNKLLLLLILGSIETFGQQRVYQRDKFEKEILSKTLAEKQYPSATRSKDKNNEIQNLALDEQKINNDFMKAAIKKNSKYISIVESKNMPIEIFFNKNGEVDYLVYGFSSFDNRVFNGKKFLFDTLNTEESKVFYEVAEDFCKKYKCQLKGIENNYSFYIGLGFGKGQKKMSKKYISTIEMAENCTNPDTVKILMLNKLYLINFPEVVLRFKNLEKLDLSDNYIEQVPSKIWGMKKMKFLSLSGNYVDYTNFGFKRNKHLKDLNLQYTGMSKMPKSLKRNRRLEILFVGNNPIKFTDNDFNRMKRLKALNLYNVRTSTLPKSIGKLNNLEELDLYYNDFQFLPVEVCRLANLKTLALSNNQLWNLPDEIAKMPKLQTLYAHHNRLNSLPNLPNLKFLDVGYNLFKVFPEQIYELQNLEEFDITNNQVEEVPEKLLGLKKLQKVYIRGNVFYKVNEKSKELSKLVADLEQRQVLVR